MGDFTLCNSMMSTCVSKNMLGFQSDPAKPYRPISCTALPCVKISAVPKNLFKFGSGSATSHMLLSSTTLPSVRISAVSENLLGDLKDQCKNGWILSQTHPQSARIESIAIKILEALQRKTGRRHMLADQQWVQENNSEAKLIKKARRGENVKSTSEHLKEGIAWEFFVVDVPLVQAGYINIGKILVFRGLFDRFKTDAELAMIIAKQVGHVVSRHPQRSLALNLLYHVKISLNFMALK
ncbi:hypothetical protein AG4045_028435 [Apium graveolens]|uniref:Peptidase M48 domain-containing protein n=1 Tax=Apium graveolens TaxID=4045 RepID=A0A6L5B9V4_APIGR|nr:hypothetical protein AG4045_028435 [Apium graveolens]